MGKIIAIVNQKGGVAKTTTVFNLAALCAMSGKKTLMIDFDFQASLTIETGYEPLDFEYNNIAISMKTFIDKKEKTVDIKECILKVEQIDNLYICPSIIDLADLESLLTNVTFREKTLSNVLKSIKDEYDYIFIDCSPSLGNLTVNAMTCANYIIAPCETDYLAFRGLKSLESTIEDIKELVNYNLEFLGVIATKYEKNSKAAREILELLEEEYKVLGVIKKSVDIKRGRENGLPIVAIKNSSLTEEIKDEYKKIAQYILNLQ